MEGSKWYHGDRGRRRSRIWLIFFLSPNAAAGVPLRWFHNSPIFPPGISQRYAAEPSQRSRLDTTRSQLFKHKLIPPCKSLGKSWEAVESSPLPSNIVLLILRPRLNPSEKPGDRRDV